MSKVQSFTQPPQVANLRHNYRSTWIVKSRPAAARMAASLARAEEARRNQTADVAHELRTPLTVIQGTLEAMLDGVYPADRENLQAALVQMRTISRLVEDLRLLALADAGQLRLHTAPLNLAPFLREIVGVHQPQAQEREVSLTLETPPSLPSRRIGTGWPR